MLILCIQISMTQMLVTQTPKTWLVLQTTISTDHQMEKTQEKLLQVMGLLSRLWKGLEDVRNESFEAVEVSVETFATLTDQTTLL